jgi:hypothetical protein
VPLRGTRKEQTRLQKEKKEKERFRGDEKTAVWHFHMVSGGY